LSQLVHYLSVHVGERRFDLQEILELGSIAFFDEISNSR
jgi:hypothetical protein